MLTGRPSLLLLEVEVRLAWRSLFGSVAAARAGLVLLAVTLGLAHVVAGMLVGLLPDGPVAARALVAGYLSLDMAMLLLFGFMVSSSTMYALDSLFEQGGIDMVLASPTATRALFSSKALAIAARAVAPFAVIVLPLANMAILDGHAGFWGLYPVLGALGLAGCSVGIGLAVLLVRACGVGAARRRLFMMNMALLGVLALALAGWRLWISPAIESAAADPHLQEVLATLVSPDHWMWMPARAALGDLGGIVLLSAGALFLFRLLGAAMADQYVAGMLASRAGAMGARRRSAEADAGLGCFPIAAKEWLLIRRSPELFLQALFQSAALGLLLAFFLRRDGAGSIEAQVEALLPAAAVVFLAALTARVAWLVVSAEEAPALLAACPQAPRIIRLQKMGVAFVVTLAPALLLCAWFATRGLASAIWLLCMAMLANGSLAAMHAWNTGTGARRDVVRRGKSMPLVLRMVEGMTVAAWGAATYGVPHAAWWGFPALALAIVLPLVSSFRSASKQQEGAY